MSSPSNNQDRQKQSTGKQNDQKKQPDKDKKQAQDRPSGESGKQRK